MLTPETLGADPGANLVRGPREAQVPKPRAPHMTRCPPRRLEAAPGRRAVLRGQGLGSQPKLHDEIAACRLPLRPQHRMTGMPPHEACPCPRGQADQCQAHRGPVTATQVTVAKTRKTGGCGTGCWRVRAPGPLYHTSQARGPQEHRQAGGSTQISVICEAANGPQLSMLARRSPRARPDPPLILNMLCQ